METAPVPQPAPEVRTHGGISLPRVVHVEFGLIMRLAAVFVLMVGIFLAWLGSNYLRMEKENDLALARADNDRTLHLSSQAIDESLAGVISDLRYIGSHNELNAFLSNGAEGAGQDLASEYAALLRQKRDYDQIRFINLDGEERVRVNKSPGGAYIVPAAELQAKATRYYFPELTRLRSNEIYVSPMDLNVEYGEASKPFKPMIRVGLAVSDQQGVRRGYVIINYLADHLLRKILNVAGTDHPLWLLDSQGEWLLASSPEVAWSGVLLERRMHGFARNQATIWEAMRQRASGTFTLAGKNYQYKRVYPLRMAASASAGDSLSLALPVAADTYYWYLIVASVPAHMSAGQDRHAGMTLWLGIAITAMALGLSLALAYALARQWAMARTLGHAIDTLPAQIAYIDAKQLFRFSNRAYLDLYGRTPNSLYGRHVREILGDDGYAQIQPYLDQALQGRQAEFELHWDSGPGPSDLAVTLVPDVSGKGQVRGIYAYATDVSQRKALEQREREHQVELSRVTRLACAGEIASEVAHQINQPLAAISMFSHSAQRTIEKDKELTGEQTKLRDWMATINAQAKRASEVVERMRHFARRDESQEIPLDINSSVRTVVAMVKGQAKAKNIVIKLDLAESLPIIQVSGIMIEQVLFNMLHNVIRTASEGTLTREISVRTHADAIRVWVEISGQCINFDGDAGTNDMELDIECFNTVLRSGLAISRSIINGYDGDLVFTNNAPGVNTVSFYLPIILP